MLIWLAFRGRAKPLNADAPMLVNKQPGSFSLDDERNHVHAALLYFWDSN
jgi:hypothetical protein